MNRKSFYIDGATMIAPGSDCWSDFSRLVQSDDFPALDERWKAAPKSLAPRALRRLSPQTLLAIAVAEQIEPCVAENAAWVFASAFGEGETLKVILDALCSADMAVRPLRFQNSVHNAASGQWTIAQHIQNPVTSICGGEDTVGAGLLKSAMQLQLEDRPIGLVMYDMPLPPPLSTSHRLTMTAGVGIALSPRQTDQSLARAQWSICEADLTAAKTGFSRKALATKNPIFAALPLLERLLGKNDDRIVLRVNGNARLCLEVSEL